jgi:hypothetical protein
MLLKRCSDPVQKCEWMLPFFLVQSIRQDINQSGILILMRQMFDTDLKRYGEYFPLDADRKEQIRAFPVGKAVIILPDGTCPTHLRNLV